MPLYLTSCYSRGTVPESNSVSAFTWECNDSNHWLNLTKIELLFSCKHLNSTRNRTTIVELTPRDNSILNRIRGPCIRSTGLGLGLCVLRMLVTPACIICRRRLSSAISKTTLAFFLRVDVLHYIPMIQGVSEKRSWALFKTLPLVFFFLLPRVEKIFTLQEKASYVKCLF